ncbi:pyridoxal-phosphate-dependent aminotransferase family protein [Sulfuracidifex tepidarius]|uniref:2-aminoethylphosphonate--pyruvate transaminase n=1 Tax=Sulfuracidifex tepidarius TaxID=1294262 RepID=A0A510E261_9CREN|nr:alanine--glyoxylate aminotransferase family protein [Sulfuracidifex tepidarius]BBG23802.1 2-aminoethylphosphonate--pyruvate transaminase [Sulfuracidifex tepidarius]BBG26557.1 2-aminoethylphosphonate--pyruvate transaminase [Sulfuracidifex tepidarius]
MMLIPGPVNVPLSVSFEASRVVNHRSDEFRRVVEGLESSLKRLFSAERVALLSGSGTLAVESMVFSMTRKGEKVITIPYGEFGHRLEESLKRRGTNVVSVTKSPGTTPSLGEIEDLLDKHKDAETVALVHNETSTGVALRNLREVAKLVKGSGRKLLVDSVSGFAAYELYVKEWKIDAVATGSQKALASVPGLGFVALSDEGIGELKGEDIPHYVDVATHLKFQDKRETPFTPAVGVFYASYRASQLMEIEGKERRWKRHDASARYLRDIFKKIGMENLGEDDNFSNTVVASTPPVPVSYMVSELKKRGIEISRGMGEMKDKITRVGILGVVDDRALSRLVFTVQDVLKKDVYYPPPEETKLPEALKTEVIWD